MSFWEQLFRTKKQRRIRAAALAKTQLISGSPLKPPLDQVLDELLENWDQRYTYALDREARRLHLGKGSTLLQATETSHGTIVLALEHEGQSQRMECSIQEAPEIIEKLLLG